MTLAVIRPVDPATLPVYPLDGTERLESHWFMPWERRRWLNSGMNLHGTDASRIHYFNLINIAYDHQPIGTLPNDLDLLARLLFVDAKHFRAMCALPYGPLHKWELCLCGDEVRLMHPMIVSTLIEAISRKEDNRAKTDAANKSKALQRVRSRLAAIDVQLATNDDAVRWIDGWFDRQGVKRRDDAQYRAALAAWMDHVRRATGRDR